jgi:hypothetical protein
MDDLLLLFGPFNAGGFMKTAQIGASGVLLIQYRLLKLGIESAPMTTDDGIDLVVYSPALGEALTMQVKTCLKRKPSGGKGKPTLDWWLRSDSPAQLVGLVNLEDDSVWLLRHREFEQLAQQKPHKLHLYFYTDPDYLARPGCHARDFDRFLIERRIGEVFQTPIE